VVDLLKWAHGDRVPVPPADADLPPSTHGGGIRDRLAASRGPMGPTPLPQSMESVMANLHADQQIAADGGRAARQGFFLFVYYNWTKINLL
jgi:hypothetical protein